MKGNSREKTVNWRIRERERERERDMKLTGEVKYGSKEMELLNIL